MVDIKGLDKARVLKALYDERITPITIEWCQELVERRKYFDTLAGRVLKVDLSGDEFDERMYDEEIGSGAAQRAIDRIRAERDAAEGASGKKKEHTMEEKAELSRVAIIKILEILKKLPPDVSATTCTMLKMVLPGPMGGMAGLMMGGPFSLPELFRSVEKPMGWPSGMGPRGWFG